MSSDIELCRSSIAVHSKSFALASRLLAPTQRDHVAAVYAWCRRADDAIDLVSVSEQPGALGRLRRELDSLFAGEVMNDPVLSAFQSAARACGIPQRYPSELLDGMEMDVLGYRYRTWEDLRLYCYRVASTVGLMMCHVMGVSSARALPYAIDLGIAMQLTNIARDVHEDWLRGRSYLPLDLLTEFGASHLNCSSGQVLTEHERDLLRPLVRDLLGIAEAHYVSADQGLDYLSRRDAFAVASARWIYSDIGRQLAGRNYDVLAPRASVPLLRKLWLVAKAGFQVLGKSGASGDRGTTRTAA